MWKYILLGCLLFTGCVSTEYVQYLERKVETNVRNIKTVRLDLKNHFDEDHTEGREVTELEDGPDKPKLSNSWIVKAIRFVATVGGSFNPVFGIAGGWLLTALPFIFGKPEEEENGS